ncbi:MAG: FecR family protein [Gracilimonas sp.]|nr:FecR family protein [Gracilimonas sp.]
MKRLFKYVYISVFLITGMGFVSSSVINSTSDRPIAIVKHFKPDVNLRNLEVDKDLMLDPQENMGEQLFSGDSLITREEGFALVVFMDRSVAKVKPSSMLILKGEVGTASKEMSTRIDLEEGEVFLEVQPQGGNDFEVATNRSLASVKGTNFGNRSDGYIWVQEGQVDVTALNSGQTVSLFEKMYAQVDDQGNDIQSGTLSDEEIEELDEGFDEVEDNDLEQKEIILKFRDQNGQLQEITIDVFEEGNN